MPTVPSTLRATARRVPETVAIKFGDFSCTYAELDAEVDRPLMRCPPSGWAAATGSR